jgi:hypothetical protein
MGFVRQTWTLTKKNLRIAVVRNWFSTFLRAFLLPIVFVNPPSLLTLHQLMIRLDILHLRYQEVSGKLPPWHDQILTNTA